MNSYSGAALRFENNNGAGVNCGNAGADRNRGPAAQARVAILGATGYVGRELITLLTRHPAARIDRLMSSGEFGAGPVPIEQSHPALRGLSLPAGSETACYPLDLERFNASPADVAFLAVPHETSHDLVPQLLERGLLLVDLSGAFRLKDPDLYSRWYGFQHCRGALLDIAVYGLPELNAPAIRKAQLVANPGCYATSIILALAPLVEAGWADTSAGIVCDSKSGVSGAGRTPSDAMHFPEVSENCRAYSPFNHRHVPEMIQALGLEEQQFTFTPHLLPITRGILSTIYVPLSGRRSLPDVFELYRNFYERSPLVRVYTDGMLPQVQAVAHTNYADLGFAMDDGGQRLVIVSALDNLRKGAAAQAVQNMNLMLGLDPEAGLL